MPVRNRKSGYVQKTWYYNVGRRVVHNDQEEQIFVTGQKNLSGYLVGKDYNISS